MPFIGASCVRLGFLKKGQHLLEGPLPAAKLRPLVVFERVAAQIQHAVYTARTAKNAPLEPREFSPVQCGHRLGLEIPVTAREATGDERSAGNPRRQP